MSEPFQPESLSPFEARLAQLSPRSAQVDRDEVLFEAGRQAAFAEQRGARRKWYVACSALAAAVCVQSIWLYGGGDAAKTAAVPPTAVAAAQPDPVPPGAGLQPAPPIERIVQAEPFGGGSTSVSFWSALLSSPAADRLPAAADHLSVGSAAKGTLRESFVVPQLGGLPSREQSPLSPRNSDWSPE